MRGDLQVDGLADFAASVVEDEKAHDGLPAGGGSGGVEAGFAKTHGDAFRFFGEILESFAGVAEALGDSIRRFCEVEGALGGALVARCLAGSALPVVVPVHSEQSNRRNHVTFAEVIIKERERQGLTQAELARRARIGQSAMVRLESGKHGVSEAMLRKIADALDREIELKFK